MHLAECQKPLARRERAAGLNTGKRRKLFENKVF
nr:MAG TPA: hypothetical protein [Caudoviricetes sp.]